MTGVDSNSGIVDDSRDRKEETRPIISEPIRTQFPSTRTMSDMRILCAVICNGRRGKVGTVFGISCEMRPMSMACRKRPYLTDGDVCILYVGTRSEAVLSADRRVEDDRESKDGNVHEATRSAS